MLLIRFDPFYAFGSTPFTRNISLICRVAYAQGDTAGFSFPGLDELLIQLIFYPFIGVGFSFLIFGITRKAWAFLLAPFFYWGLSSIAPVNPTSDPTDLPPFFSLAGAWVYWTQILAIVVAYLIYGKTKKVWLFFLAPVFGWFVQILSLMVIAS